MMSRANSAYSVPASGISFFSLVASTENKFYETVSFYMDLGFVEITVYDRALPTQKRETDHCLTSEKETWLLSQGESVNDGANVTLKIRLVSDPRFWKDGVAVAPGNASVMASDPDWRGSNQSWVLHTPHIARIVELLKSKNLPYQCQPNEHQVVEVYTHDPLGSLIGFSKKFNPFTTRVGSKVGLFAPLTKDSMLRTPVDSRPVTPDGTRKRRIGIMTSGGDAPGMNAAVRAVVRMTIAKGCESYGIYEGYEGLLRGGKFIKRMYWEDVRGWLSEGGTLIGTARCAGFREREGRLSGAKNLIDHGIDSLIICGGDGSLTGADLFRTEWPSLLEELVKTKKLTQEAVDPYQHLNIVGLVGSIDNDMTGTDATIGCYSSLTRICQAVDYIDATAYSHSRAFVVEVMGRHCGWLALMAGLSTGADFVFLPEKPPSEGWEEDMCGIIAKVCFLVRLICFDDSDSTTAP